MISGLLTPLHGPRWRGKKIAVASPIHVSNTHTKFGWISSIGLGGADRMGLESASARPCIHTFKHEYL